MIDNPLQMNDWGIKFFLKVVLVVQLVMLGLTGLSTLGFEIPVLHQIVGFIYLSFIPGLIILRILRLHQLGSIRTLLYSVGLSLAFDMFLGFLINLLYPHIGIPRPISTLPLIITCAVVLGLLCFVAYIRDKGFSTPPHFNVHELLSPPVLFFILLPLLAIVGTQLVNSYANNALLLILIALIAVIGLVIMLTKFIHVRFYPLAVFSIALALLWHSSLISQYLTGWDIFTEYYYYSQVAQPGLWNSTLPHNYNAALSITVLPATFSQLLNMGGEQVFKIIYPVWYALVPVALYAIYSKYLSTKQAFSATFFFMSIYVFYLIMPSLARQMVGQLFCALLIMLITDREATSSMKTLFIVFGASLVVSHYALSYIYIGFLVLSLIMLHLLREKRFHITTYSVALFSVICLAWYMYVSSAAPLAAVVHLGKHIYENLSLEFLNPFSRDVSLHLLATSTSALHLANRILYYLMLLFMAAGALRVVSGLRQRESPKTYLALAIGNYILLAACVIIPFFGEQLGTQRMFHLSAIVLAPFAILGAEATFNASCRVARSTTRLAFQPRARMVISPILALFFLFNSGFAYEVAHDPWVDSLPLSLTAIEDRESHVYFENKVNLRSICPTEQEALGARWLAEHMNRTRDVYATPLYYEVPALRAYGLIPKEQTIPILDPPLSTDVKDGYVYLGYVNVVFGYGVTSYTFLPKSARKASIWDISRIYPLLDNRVKAYTNGATEIYCSP